jgi:hypothetical protein
MLRKKPKSGANNANVESQRLYIPPENKNEMNQAICMMKMVKV